jgi:hypothetical protein
LDLVVITEPLVKVAPGQPERPIPWQKCLIPSQPFAQNYSQIAILDADIVINPGAPNIFDQVPPERIGGVISGSHIHDDLKLILLSRLTKKPVPYEPRLPNQPPSQWRSFQDSYYHREGGLTPQPAGIINTGVLVVSPLHHAELFRAVFNSEHAITRQFEQVRLSHAILSAGLFHPIDTRFNSVLHETLLVHHYYLLARPTDELIRRDVIRAELVNNFFLHFAYDQNMMQLLPE